MNPDFQDVEVDPTQTFAGRLAGLDALRSTNSDWRDKAIDQALNSGKYLEERFNRFQLEINQRVSEAASSKVQSDIMLDVNTLKNDSARRERRIAILAVILGTIISGVILQLTEHLWK